MTAYTDGTGRVTFDPDTIARLTKLAEQIKNGELELIKLPHMTREECLQYLRGEMSPELQRKFDEANPK